MAGNGVPRRTDGQCHCLLAGPTRSKAPEETASICVQRRIRCQLSYKTSCRLEFILEKQFKTLDPKVLSQLQSPAPGDQQYQRRRVSCQCEVRANHAGLREKIKTRVSPSPCMFAITFMVLVFIAARSLPLS